MLQCNRHNQGQFDTSEPRLLCQCQMQCGAALLVFNVDGIPSGTTQGTSAQEEPLEPDRDQRITGLTSRRSRGSCGSLELARPRLHLPSAPTALSPTKHLLVPILLSFPSCPRSSYCFGPVMPSPACHSSRRLVVNRTHQASRAHKVHAHASNISFPCRPGASWVHPFSHLGRRTMAMTV